MQIKTIPSRLQKCKSFVYAKITWVETTSVPALDIEIKTRLISPPVCSSCGCKRSGYDIDKIHPKENFCYAQCCRSLYSSALLTAIPDILLINLCYITCDPYRRVVPNMSTTKKKEKPSKTLTWRGSGQGLGDRILGLASVLVVAEETNRELAFVWKKNSRCRADFNDIFDMNVRLVPRAKKEKFDIVHPGFNPYLIFEEAKSKNMLSCTRQYFLARVVQKIKSLKFKSSIYTEVGCISAKWNLSEAIGLHLRETEKKRVHHNYKRLAYLKPWFILKRYGFFMFLTILFESSQNITRKRLVQCAVRECQRLHLNKIFIASDSKEGLEYLKKKLSRKKLEIYHLKDAHTQKNTRRQTSVQYVAIDLILLSRCRIILSSIEKSSFSLVSAAMSNDSDIKFIFL